jgi:ubiquinone/menaquinone biosynthesis C-methylase UbiE
MSPRVDPTATAHEQAVVTYYDTHPINEQQILEKLEADGIALEGLTEAVLQNYDQDHYGGIESTETLAEDAGITAAHHVLDICSGMGGPACYLAFHRGCRVTGLDLTESRFHGATRLTALAGLDHLVDFTLGDAQAMPFPDHSFDVAISQEAWLHVPDKARVVAECARVVKPGGIIAFTDLTRNADIDDESMARLEKALASVNYASVEEYRFWLEGQGCQILKVTDRSEELKSILTERLKMYRSLGAQTRNRFGAAREREWEEGYRFFVDTVVTGRLGGCRIIARTSK